MIQKRRTAVRTNILALDPVEHSVFLTENAELIETSETKPDKLDKLINAYSKYMEEMSVEERFWLPKADDRLFADDCEGLFK